MHEETCATEPKQRCYVFKREEGQLKEFCHESTPYLILNSH